MSSSKTVREVDVTDEQRVTAAVDFETYNRQHQRSNYEYSVRNAEQFGLRILSIHLASSAALVRLLLIYHPG